MMLANTFKKQVAIITGAGQGIGLQIASELCKHGASVILNDVDEELAQNAASQITAENGNCFAMAGDASDVSFIESMVNEAVSRYGQLTIAIANAGITLFGDFLDYEKEAFDKVMNVNMRGSFFLAQVAAKQIIKQKSGGSILLISSVTGHQAHKNLAAYSMTKAGIEMLAKNLVTELSQYNITVNAIAPGATLTERTIEDADYENTWSRITPLGRPANVKDIANAALFLVSPFSKNITGQSLIIDGGWT
jgi:NAD(P)-dependent dehydrogenase (short-subunit alcohol dehydrogenase family)